MPTRAGRSALSLILELVGFAALTVGAFTLATWLGFMFAGAALLVAGVALEPPPMRRRRSADQ